MPTLILNVDLLSLYTKRINSQNETIAFLAILCMSTTMSTTDSKVSNMLSEYYINKPDIINGSAGPLIKRMFYTGFRPIRGEQWKWDMILERLVECMLWGDKIVCMPPSFWLTDVGTAVHFCLTI